MVCNELQIILENSCYMYFKKYMPRVDSFSNCIRSKRQSFNE